MHKFAAAALAAPILLAATANAQVDFGLSGITLLDVTDDTQTLGLIIESDIDGDEPLITDFTLGLDLDIDGDDVFDFVSFTNANPPLLAGTSFTNIDISADGNSISADFVPDAPFLLSNLQDLAVVGLQFTTIGETGSSATINISGVTTFNTADGPLDVTLRSLTVVPEPATASLLAVGALALVRRRRA